MRPRSIAAAPERASGRGPEPRPRTARQPAPSPPHRAMTHDRPVIIQLAAIPACVRTRHGVKPAIASIRVSDWGVRNLQMARRVQTGPVSARESMPERTRVGGGDHVGSGGLQDPAALRQIADRIGQVFDHVRHHDHVESRIGVICAANVPTRASTGAAGRGNGVRVGHRCQSRRGPARLHEPPHRAAIAAADIQQKTGVARRQPEQLAQGRRAEPGQQRHAESERVHGRLGRARVAEQLLLDRAPHPIPSVPRPARLRIRV
jgi:hypothetical protein